MDEAVRPADVAAVLLRGFVAPRGWASEHVSDEVYTLYRPLHDCIRELVTARREDRRQDIETIVSSIYALIDRMMPIIVSGAPNLCDYVKYEQADTPWSIIMGACALAAPLSVAALECALPPMPQRAPYFSEALDYPDGCYPIRAAGVLHTLAPVSEYTHADVDDTLAALGDKRLVLPLGDLDNVLRKFLLALLHRSLLLTGAGMSDEERKIYKIRAGKYDPRDRTTHVPTDEDMMRRLPTSFVQLLSFLDYHNALQTIPAEDYVPDLAARADVIREYVHMQINRMSDGAVRREGVKFAPESMIFFGDVEETRRIEAYANIKAMHVLLRSKSGLAQVRWHDYMRRTPLRDMVTIPNEGEPDALRYVSLMQYVCSIHMRAYIVSYMFNALEINFTGDYNASAYYFFRTGMTGNNDEPRIIDVFGRPHVYYRRKKIPAATYYDAVAVWGTIVLVHMNGMLGGRNASEQLRVLLGVSENATGGIPSSHNGAIDF